MLPVLAACIGGGDEADAEGASDQGGEQADPAPDPEEVVETRELVTAFGRCEVGIRPLVRSGDHCVLTLDIAATAVPEGESSLDTNRFEAHASPLHAASYLDSWAGVRLVDAGGSAIRLPATTADGTILVRASESAGEETYSALRLDQQEDDPLRVQLLYAVPEEDVTTIGLLIPGWYIDAVPVIDAEVPAARPGDGAEALEELIAEVENAPVIPLEGYSSQLGGGVQVIESTEQVQIDLAGDVLFDSSSSEIDARADKVLDAAAATISAYEGGTVDVVGHTDDVGGDAENQTLSEERAAAVVDALADRLDTASYELRPEGRGESEPIASNDSAANRQRNRRVTLTLTAARTSQTEVGSDGELPEFDAGPLDDGAEAAGPDGFERSPDDDHSYHVTVPSARRVNGMLEVTVLAERLPGEGTGAYGSALDLGAGVYSYRGKGTGYSSDNAGFAPRLLMGTSAVYPLDYALGESAIEGHVEWRNASDPRSGDDAAPGDTLRFVALYRDIPGAETLVLDQPFVLGIAPYRLTDIPIEG
jgi:outer membrane protein OmpA-like peptidoglycan-associated protein